MHNVEPVTYVHKCLSEIAFDKTKIVKVFTTVNMLLLHTPIACRFYHISHTYYFVSVLSHSKSSVERSSQHSDQCPNFQSRVLRVQICLRVDCFP